MSAFSRTCGSALSRLYRLSAQPAATIVLLRDAPASAKGVECLLLLKGKAQRFGGLHVFPGGAIDAEDEVRCDDSGALDVLATAANGATRELHEETNLRVRDGTMALISHWMPPKLDAKKRGKTFSTFFFCGALDDATSVHVDGTEIINHKWLSPTDARTLHGRGEMQMLPPTLHTLASVEEAAAAILASGGGADGASSSAAAETARALAAAPPRSFNFDTLFGTAVSLPRALPAMMRWYFAKGPAGART